MTAVPYVGWLGVNSGKKYLLTDLESKGDMLVYKETGEHLLPADELRLIEVTDPRGHATYLYSPSLSVRSLAERYELFVESFFKKMNARKEDVRRYRSRIETIDRTGVTPKWNPTPKGKTIDKIAVQLIKDMYGVDLVRERRLESTMIRA